MKLALFTCTLAVLLLACVVARAETLQAPVGGKAITVGEGRVACPGSTGDWAIEQEGRAVRPPVGEDAVGRSVEMKVAPSAAACASSAAPVTLVATGRFPAIEPTGTTLFVDDARVEVRGRGLRGVVVRWQVGDRSGVDRCVQPQSEAGGAERCAVGVGRGLPADPTTADLWWLPAGSRDGPDVTTFDSGGRRIGRDETLLRPVRVVVASLVPSDVSIDLAGGTASRIPLAHPESVVGADCGAASCDVSGNAIVVSGLSSVSGTLAVRLRLAPRVVLQRGDAFDPTPVVQVPVLPCGMSIASGDALRGVDASRAVVRVDARCAGEAGTLRWFSAGRALEVLSVVDSGGAAFVLLGIGRVEGDELVVTASRGGADGSIVGQARIRTRAMPPPHATLALEDGSTIDFVPTNRAATVGWAKTQGGGELVLLPLDGVYDVASRDGLTTLQGQRGAGGFVSLRFAWRVPTLPGALANVDLAIVTDPVERPMHEASVPLPLGASAVGPRPLVELLCGDGADLRRIAPGAAAHVSFGLRDACRLVFHRERLTPDDGVQRLQLDVDVTGVDGTARPEAHVSQLLVLRAGDQPRYAWIKGVTGSFDRVTIRVAHADDALTADAAREEPAVQWSLVFGTAHWRLYGTTAIPTGLYRVSDANHSGILSLNFGVIMRATWLDSEGHGGFLGLEAGMMAVGLANDTSPASGRSLTQVATVTGLGLSVPIANRSLATETSINLHAWFEYEVSRDLGGEPGSPLGFVFGPSISIGNIGTNL
ncbi:MAG TPA: hypothetical protein VMI75_37485 [Polyangiaceae bacterium]|nr:hypothetical protein [Polyangiaceae bacterium]